MNSLEEQLDGFAADADQAPAAEPKKQRKARAGHASAFETGLPIPGEEPPAPTPTSGPHVYAAISAVMGGLAQIGIAKDRPNTQQGYKFRGIDDVYNALASLLVRHKLVILPHVEDRTVSERVTRNGGVLTYVTLRMTFDLVSAVDGSVATVSSFGEAMDSGDKATNKALSTAYKYMAMQTFCIPTIGTDPEQDTYEVVASPQRQQTAMPELPRAPSPRHIEVLMQTLREKTAGPRQQAEAWWHGLEPEDQATLRAELQKETRQ